MDLRDHKVIANSLVIDNSPLEQDYSQFSLAIIGGSDRLPYHLVDNLIQNKINFIVFALDFRLYWNLKRRGIKAYFVTITKIGKIISLIKQHHIQHLMMVGRVLRPAISWLAGLDKETKRLLNYLNNLSGGDNKLLSKIIDFVEQEYSLKVINPRQYLNNILLPDNFSTLDYTEHPMLKSDIQLGKTYLNNNSDYDIGQAVIVRNGQIIAIEAVEGTAEMLRRAARYKDRINGYGGVLVKLPKLNQDLRLDLPTIGLSTVKEVVKAGLSAIAVAANNCFVVEKEQVIKFACNKRIAIIAIDL